MWPRVIIFQIKKDATSESLKNLAQLKLLVQAAAIVLIAQGKQRN